MRYLLFVCGFSAALLAACAGARNTGFRNLRAATYVQVECLDANADHRLNAQDAAAAKGEVDAAFLQGIDIPLDAAKEQTACAGKNRDWGPEYIVARRNAGQTIDCANGARPVLLVGVGGAISNLKRGQAAGVISIVDGLQQAFQRDGVPTFAIVSGEAVIGATNVHSSMEDWLTNAVEVYLRRLPCLRVAFVGHSHGGVTVDVVASRLEQAYAARIIEVVDVDRVDTLYVGDTQSWPSQAPLLNIFETNDAQLRGAAHDAPNTENWDASGEQAPIRGDKGGPLEQVNHTTIDNAASVKQRIIDDVLSRAR